MVSRLTKEQLDSLGRHIGFVGILELSSGTVLHVRFEIEKALTYYQVARTNTFSNDLKQRIVAAVQQRQQEELQKTSQEQNQEQYQQQAITLEDQSAQDEVQDDFQTIILKLIIEQLETLNSFIGFVDIKDQFVTESSLRSKLQRALEYYNVPGSYIYSNELMQKIVAAVQQRQQEILKLQDQVALRRKQALQGILVLPALEYEKDYDYPIYNEPFDLFTFELDKCDNDLSQPSSEARIKEFLNQRFTEEPYEPVDISILQPLSSEALENIRQRKKKPIQAPVQKIDDQATLKQASFAQPEAMLLLDDQDEQGNKSIQFETIKEDAFKSDHREQFQQYLEDKYKKTKASKNDLNPLIELLKELKQ
ncbi:MAG: hypothetical protein EZS28_020307 [Streblomastix strix]|uniref:Uncharacterized protein n=1 Tax=Streblomastix strix TaxID=222440 RepID=A0A5J4VND8_9EUKA|nr:MAG: hypothetical protein EZS28_020307 [Streblomastix strix]